VNTIERLFSLSGRGAVVTGASAGLGVEFANALAGAGADVVLMARRQQQLRETAERLQERHGTKVSFVVADLSQGSSREQAFAEAAQRLGGIDVLVNNAGVAPTGRAEAQWPEAWHRTLDLNLTAAFHCCLLAAERMRAAGRGGRIINVSSIFGHLGSSLFRVSAYAASKGAVENLNPAACDRMGARRHHGERARAGLVPRPK